MSAADQIDNATFIRWRQEFGLVWDKEEQDAEAERRRRHERTFLGEYGAAGLYARALTLYREIKVRVSVVNLGNR
jgi:hypothetical protein